MATEDGPVPHDMPRLEYLITRADDDVEALGTNEEGRQTGQMRGDSTAARRPERVPRAPHDGSVPFLAVSATQPAFLDHAPHSSRQSQSFQSVATRPPGGSVSARGSPGGGQGKRARESRERSAVGRLSGVSFATPGDLKQHEAGNKAKTGRDGRPHRSPQLSLPHQNSILV